MRLIAVALMPYVSVGERGRLLLGRLVRLTLWASTSVILAALAVEVLEILDDGQFVSRAQPPFPFITFECLVINPPAI